MSYESNVPLPKTMQAVVCHGPRDYRLEEWAVPQPGPDSATAREIAARYAEPAADSA